jgi:hypothetical protein
MVPDLGGWPEKKASEDGAGKAGLVCVSTWVANTPSVRDCNRFSKSLMYQRQFSPDQSHISRCVSRVVEKTSLSDVDEDQVLDLLASVIRLSISLFPFTMIQRAFPVLMSSV